jgi:Zn-dependent protease
MPDATAELERAAADIPLTRAARDILERASAMAATRGASPSPSDVLQATLSSQGTLAYEAIRALGIDPSTITAQLPAPDGSGPAAIPLRQLLVNANREAQVLGHYHVDSIHLLLAMLYSDSPETSAPLQKAGLTIYDLRRYLQTGTTADFQPGESDRLQGSRSQPDRARSQQAQRGRPGAGRPSSPDNRLRPDAALRRKPWPSLRGVIKVSPVFLGLVAITAASGAMMWSDVLPAVVGPLTILFVTTGWITSVCVHEFGHAFVAYLGGDRSVRASGYLDLNPLRYTNVLLSLVMPVLFLLLGGIGLPGGAVYIDRGALRSRAWDSAVSVAGPVGTVVCGVLVAIPFLVPGHLAWVTSTNVGFFAALAFLGFIEVIALLLNLLPVPGLDGFGILRPWLPNSVQGLANQYGQLGILAVFAALWFVPPVRDNFFPLVAQITSLAGIDLNLIAIGQLNMRLH